MRGARLTVLLLLRPLAAIFLPVAAHAADVEFTGGLERITPESILIRLADGKRIDAKLPKAGALAAETISAQYNLGDEIQITCKPMGQDQCLDLKSLKFLRPPTPRERCLGRRNRPRTRRSWSTRVK
jgi:hypothetical protein